MRSLSSPARYLAAEFDNIFESLRHRIYPLINRFLLQFLFPSSVNDVLDRRKVPVWR